MQLRGFPLQGKWQLPISRHPEAISRNTHNNHLQAQVYWFQIRAGSSAHDVWLKKTKVFWQTEPSVIVFSSLYFRQLHTFRRLFKSFGSGRNVLALAVNFKPLTLKHFSSNTPKESVEVRSPNALPFCNLKAFLLNSCTPFPFVDTGAIRTISGLFAETFDYAAQTYKHILFATDELHKAAQSDVISVGILKRKSKKSCASAP